LDITLKAQATKEKINEEDHIKLKASVQLRKQKSKIASYRKEENICKPYI
jgi:hypothetical protein